MSLRRSGVDAWRHLAALGSMAVAALLAMPVLADELRVTLPDRSRLVFQVPAGWQHQLKQARPPLVPPQEPVDVVPTLHLSPDSGSAFRVVVTTYWREHPGVPLPTPADVRARVRVSADAATARSVERVIPLRHFEAPRGVHGAYFTATDRAPAPGDYARMAHGMVGFGEIALGFTLLSHEDAAQELAATLAMLTGVRREVGAR